MAEPKSVLPLKPVQAVADFRVRFTDELMHCVPEAWPRFPSAGRPLITDGQPRHMYVRRRR